MTIDQYLQVSRNLQALRQTMKLSQEEVATKIGLSRASYGQMERGIRQIDLETLSALSRFYHITMDSLINQDVQEVLTEFFIQRDCGRDEFQLLAIYSQLSDKAKGRLLERGEELHRIDLHRKKDQILAKY